MSKLKCFAIRWLWEETTKQGLIGILGALFLMFAVLCAIGPLMGIAWLVDNYSDQMLWLFIPWLIILPLTVKPLAALFGEY